MSCLSIGHCGSPACLGGRHSVELFVGEPGHTDAHLQDSIEPFLRGRDPQWGKEAEYLSDGIVWSGAGLGCLQGALLFVWVD